MCYVPGATELAIASFATAATSSVVSYMGQAQQAADINAAYNENATNSIIAFQNDIEASQLDHMATQEDAAAQQVQMRREGMIAQASALAEGSSRGIGGLSASAIHRALGFQTGESVATVERNKQFNDQRARLGMRAASDAAKSRIKSAPTARSPSLLAMGANIAGSAVSAYGMRAGLKADERAAQAAINRGK